MRSARRMDPAGETSRRRASRTWIRLLGLAAAGVAGWFVLVYLMRPPPVDSWLATVAAGDRADAAWAFEELKRAGDESLIHLARHVDRVEPAALRELVWIGSGRAARYCPPRDEPISVGLVARFVLSQRLRGHGPELTPGDPTPADPELWRAATAAFLAQGRQSPEGVWPALQRAVRSGVGTVPPSWRPGLGRVRRERDAPALLEVAAGASISEARWALEVLEELPDESFDRLAVEAGSERETPIDFVSCSECRASASGRCSLGRLVRLVLEQRLGGDSHVELSSTIPEADRALQAQDAWKRYRSGKGAR